MEGVAGEPEPPCMYCGEKKLLVRVCLDCRSKLEMAKRNVADARRDAEAWRRNYYRLQNERRREIKRSVKKGAKPRG